MAKPHIAQFYVQANLLLLQVQHPFLALGQKASAFPYSNASLPCICNQLRAHLPQTFTRVFMLIYKIRKNRVMVLSASTRTSPLATVRCWGALCGLQVCRTELGWAGRRWSPSRCHFSCSPATRAPLGMFSDCSDSMSPSKAAPLNPFQAATNLKH